MTLFFGSQKRAPVRRPPDPRQSNYVHVYGGNVLIMNELHRGAELQMVDQNQGDPFDFYLGEYKRHLRAGYVKVMNDQGSLITLMPDYTQINNANTWNGYPGGPPPGVPQPGQPVAIPSPSPQIWGQSARKEYSGFTPATQYWNWN